MPIVDSYVLQTYVTFDSFKEGAVESPKATIHNYSRNITYKELVSLSVTKNRAVITSRV